MSTILSQLWTGPAPVPADFFEYADRTVLPDFAVLDEFMAARLRWLELLDRGEQIAARLMPRASFSMPHSIGLLASTMDPAFVDGVLAAISDHALQEHKQRVLANTWQTFSDPHGAPYIKLATEFPKLRGNLTTLVIGPMLERAQAERARATPIEEARMAHKHQVDAQECGLPGAPGYTRPPVSPVLERWKDYIGVLEETIAPLKGGRREDRGEDQRARWFTQSLQTLDPIILRSQSAGNVTVAD